MKLSRRQFLKASASATSLLLLQPPSLVLAKEKQTQAGIAMLMDVSKCTNCWWCYAACKNCNSLPETLAPDLTQPPALSPEVWTTLYPVKKGEGWSSRKQACLHCTDAACVEVCPTRALSYNAQGFVQYDRDKCSGCGYCAEFCPFGVPQMEKNIVTGLAVMSKCTFCIDRVTSGEQPACAAACPHEAISFGNRLELVTEGKRRVTTLQQTNPNATLYGESEMGGLHVMYVLDDLPEVYGLPATPELPTTISVRNAFQWVGIGLAPVIISGFGLNYLIARIRMTKGAKE